MIPLLLAISGVSADEPTVRDLDPRPLARHVYPLAPPLPCPPVIIDYSEFPEGKGWMEEARALVEAWFSYVTSLLATEDFRPPDEIRLVVRPEISAPAFASGNTITINGQWITRHPHDLGMVIHELVHVVQRYPRGVNRPGWLVEGIADYIRWWRYEPEAPRPRINRERANYTDSYRTTAYWLAWVSQRYDMRLVPALDRALRQGRDPMPEFERLTGKPPETLWQEFVESLGPG